MGNTPTPQQYRYCKNNAKPHSTTRVRCQPLLLYLWFMSHAVLLRWDKRCSAQLLFLCARFPTAKREVDAVPCLSAEVYGSWEGSGYRTSREVFAEHAGTMRFQVFLMWPNLESFHKKGKRHIPSHPFGQISGPSSTCIKKPCLPLGSFQPLAKEKSWMSLDIFACIWHHFIPTQGKNPHIFLEKQEKDKWFDWNFSPWIRREDVIYRTEILSWNGRDLANQ